jgi:hypothetical protein
MKRSWIMGMVAAALAATVIVPISADVKTREHSLFKFEGMLGKVVGLFGGKAAREGIISSVAVKGNRKASISDIGGQIIDIGEEKIYDLDVKKKEYRVTTFEELRRRMEEERERAEKEARKEEGREPQKEQPRKEFEFDFKAEETGQKKQIAGYDTRQVILTVTMREKGKTLEQSGGFVMTADSWLGPEIAALKELTDFDRRYYEKLYGADMMGMAAGQMAMVLAAYPMIKEANDRIKKEGTKLKGTPIATTTTFDVVKTKEQIDAETSDQQSSGGSGLGGMLARKIAKKEPPKPRATVLTVQHEYQEVATSVAGTDLEIPAGFKEKK